MKTYALVFWHHSAFSDTRVTTMSHTAANTMALPLETRRETQDRLDEGQTALLVQAEGFKPITILALRAYIAAGSAVVVRSDNLPEAYLKLLAQTFEVIDVNGRSVKV